MLGFIHYQLIISLLQSLISSIEALMFPKKIVFRVGKKRWQTDKLFCNFCLCVGLCELQMCLAVWAGYLPISASNLSAKLCHVIYDSGLLVESEYLKFIS